MFEMGLHLHPKEVNAICIKYIISPWTNMVNPFVYQFKTKLANSETAASSKADRQEYWN